MLFIWPFLTMENKNGFRHENVTAARTAGEAAVVPNGQLCAGSGGFPPLSCFGVFFPRLSALFA